MAQTAKSRVQIHKRRRHSARWRQAGAGLLLCTTGLLTLLVLMRLPERLDTLLLVSNAVSNVISGLRHFSVGLLQLAGVLGVVSVALFALLLMAAGGVRLIRAIAPRPGKKGLLH